jgi:hypothetical protein
MTKAVVSVVTAAALLSAVRTFDDAKHGAGGYKQLAEDIGKGEEYFAALENGAQNLCEAFKALDELTLRPIAGDVSELERALFAASKRLQNWRNADGSWKGAQFGIELQNYANGAGLREDASEADEETLETVLEGYKALSERCARVKSKWTFAPVVAAIEAKLAEIRSLPEYEPGAE